MVGDIHKQVVATLTVVCGLSVAVVIGLNSNSRSNANYVFAHSASTADARIRVENTDFERLNHSARYSHFLEEDKTFVRNWFEFWTTNPQLIVNDGLDDYDEDYTRNASVPDASATVLSMK